MRRTTFGASTALLLLAGSLALALVLEHAATGQPGGEVANQPSFVGSRNCRRCHNEPLDRPLSSPDFRDFVLLHESLVWEHEDQHREAFAALTSDLGQQILRRLGESQPLEAARSDRPPHTVRQCLTCHANGRMDATDLMPGFDLSKQDGVSCESCHGPASWWEDTHGEVLVDALKLEIRNLPPHVQAIWEELPDNAVWRTLTPSDKAKFGMVDVRSPKARAKQCFSCHVGDIKQGKFVTHAMYAAGHPPLPGFEIETFARQMPPHWRNLPEKGNFLHREEFIRANYPNPAVVGQDLPQGKAVIVGGVMALRESVQLMADYAQQALDQRKRDPGGPDEAQEPVVAFPDFAAYDCASCHHELRSDSWRLNRGYHGLPPGRPPMPEWPTALLELALDHWAGGDEARFRSGKAAFEKAIQELRMAVARRPFGDPEAMHEKAEFLAAALDRLATQLAQKTFDREAAERSLRKLLDLARLPSESPSPAARRGRPAPVESNYADFHTARQIAWAYKVIRTELEAGYPADFAPAPAGPLDDQARAREAADIARWKSWLKTEWEPAEQAVNNRFNELELNQRLMLRLPAAFDNDQDDQDADENWRATYSDFQADYLAAIAAYDPRWFHAAFGQLAPAAGSAAVPKSER